MTPQQMDEILRKTLEDGRVSRAEKHVLKEILEQEAPGANRFAQLRHRAFELVREQLIDHKALQTLEWLEEIIKLLHPAAEDTSPAEAIFSPGTRCVHRLQELLGQSSRAVDICVYTITDDRIANAVLTAHDRGVAVRVISDDEKAWDKGSDIDRFRSVGIPVRVDNSEHFMHNKFAIFDHHLLVTGSYNWTRSAAQYNQENVVVTSHPHLVKAFGEQFEMLWEKFAPQG